MNNQANFLASRDIAVFDGIPSQTSRADRRAMLGVHAAAQKAKGTFSYLEIGSHLGGSLQPYVLNPSCTTIYSIDARPVITPDDRIAGGSSGYPDNSTARMISLLKDLSETGAEKIVTFDSDASEVDPAAITEAPQIAFIDGEHTARAVASDFAFCSSVIAPGGAIVFHDYRVLREAIDKAVDSVRDRGAIGLRIEGDVFGIFFDPSFVHNDPYLNERLQRHEKMKRFYPVEWGWWKVRDVLLMPKHFMSRELQSLK